MYTVSSSTSGSDSSAGSSGTGSGTGGSGSALVSSGFASAAFFLRASCSRLNLWRCFSSLANWAGVLGFFSFLGLPAFFGAISLFPFYLIEESFFFDTTFNINFLFWVLFAAISPGIIAFTLYTKVQKYVGASLAGFTLYIFSIYSAVYGIILFDEPLLYFHYYGAILVFVGVYLARKVFKWNIYT